LLLNKTLLSITKIFMHQHQDELAEADIALCVNLPPLALNIYCSVKYLQSAHAMRIAPVKW